MLRNFDFAPGVVKDDTELSAAVARGQRRWADSDRIRFVNGKPQKLGGWAKQATNTFIGICRGMFGWQDNAGVARLAVGTEKKFYVLEANTFSNITPARTSGTLGANPFATVNASTTVTVTHNGHGNAVGDYVEFSGATAVGGITISGNYAVVTAATNSYTITHSASATSTASGGGSAVAYTYEINIGRTDGAEGTGWGVGGYGGETYNTARTGTSVLLPPRTWTIQPFGVNIVACPRGGSIYQWTLNVGTRAVILANAPTQNVGILVTEEKHLVALGAANDKMLVRWSDQDANTVWTASDQNTAGSRKITGGSEILFGVRTRGTNLIFTDAAVWTMTHVGGLDVFAFDNVASGAAGIVGPQAAAEAGGVVFWMGQNDFWLYDGVVRPIPNSNDIRRFVFDNLTALQKDKVACGVNSLFNEVWWFYTTATENNRYVKFNWADKSWDVGTMARTAIIDKSVFANPLMAGTDNLIWKHESGDDNVGASSTTAMSEFIESAPFDISDGENITKVTSILPDFKGLVGTVNMSVLTRQYPQGTGTRAEEFISVIGTGTSKTDIRAAGRQAAIRIAGTSTGNDWRLGVVKLDVHPGGRK